MGYFDPGYFDAAYFDAGEGQLDALVTAVGRSLRQRRLQDALAVPTPTVQHDDEFVTWFT